MLLNCMQGRRSTWRPLGHLPKLKGRIYSQLGLSAIHLRLILWVSLRQRLKQPKKQMFHIHLDPWAFFYVI